MNCCGLGVGVRGVYGLGDASGGGGGGGYRVHSWGIFRACSGLSVELRALTLRFQEVSGLKTSGRVRFGFVMCAHSTLANLGADQRHRSKRRAHICVRNLQSRQCIVGGCDEFIEEATLNPKP